MQNESTKKQESKRARECRSKEMSRREEQFEFYSQQLVQLQTNGSLQPLKIKFVAVVDIRVTTRTKDKGKL